MKKKIIIVGIVTVIAAALIIGFVLNNKNTATLYLNGEEIKISKAEAESGEVYISAEEIFTKAKINFKEEKGKLLANGKTTLEIDKNKKEVKIGGKKCAYDCITKKDKIMISPYLAGEIIGGETVAMDKGIYMFETTPVKVKFRENNRELEFEYSDNMFAPPSYGYNHALAKMSLGTAVAAFSAKEADGSWGESGEYGREANIARLYKDMGFENIKVYNYDKSLNDASDKVAFIIGEKIVKSGDKSHNLIAVAIRGGSYGNEWASNFSLGTGKNHKGFETAANEVVSAVKNYAKDKNAKLWITGYSRGAAVANIAAARLGDEAELKRENIYAYTFGTPMGTTAEDRKDEKYGYIYNIINENDMVPSMAPSAWGFGRYGKDVKFPPMSDYNKEAAETESAKIAAIYKGITPERELDLMEMENSNQAETVRTTVEGIGKALKNRGHYTKNYEKIMVDFIECCNTKVKDRNGSWRNATAKEAILAKYKDEGEKALAAAENDTFLKGIEGQLGAAGDKIKAFGAICVKYGKSPYKIITEDIGLSDFAAIADFIGSSGSIANAHYPETYMAIMLGISNPEMLVIS